MTTSIRNLSNRTYTLEVNGSTEIHSTLPPSGDAQLDTLRPTEVLSISVERELEIEITDDKIVVRAL